MYRFNEEQMSDFIGCLAQFGAAMMEAKLNEPESDRPETPAPACPDRDELEHIVGERERVMTRMCGRWTARKGYYDVEISRLGEHFIIRYFADSGAPTGDRYILLWRDGEIYYYNLKCQIAFLVLDTATDTLIFSPGVDYTRVVEAES